ncbi:hypothetical protein E2C01_099813 [Portunus trituberculatus]|uniref:Uncharacterized protein n=1 Tax=Portunus trituberculatus TaxID=210409 RepID=A0A5B7K4R9_PORTR|nr:hypothetical protein [Portunus trituberculatus]
MVVICVVWLAGCRLIKHPHVASPAPRRQTRSGIGRRRCVNVAASLSAWVRLGDLGCGQVPGSGEGTGPEL